MKWLINLLLSYHRVLVFVVLEIICFRILISGNSYHRASFTEFSHAVAALLHSWEESVEDYFSLESQVLELQAEVDRLVLQKVMPSVPEEEALSLKSGNAVVDTAIGYQLLRAKVINNTTHFTRNYITLNKGRKDGVKEGAGVIASHGIVGIVKKVSENFSVVMSLLNQDTRISAVLHKEPFYGSVHWERGDVRTASLSDIPSYVSISEGDSIQTSGFSSIFPPGIHVGTIVSFSEQTDRNFHKILVRLSVDFNRLNYVYVIYNLTQEERVTLETQVHESQPVN